MKDLMKRKREKVKSAVNMEIGDNSINPESDVSTFSVLGKRKADEPSEVLQDQIHDEEQGEQKDMHIFSIALNLG